MTTWALGFPFSFDVALQNRYGSEGSSGVFNRTKSFSPISPFLNLKFSWYKIEPFFK